MRQPIPFGKYLLLDRVSVGGMAEVFRAKSYGVEGFEKLIAIKRILPSMGEDHDFIKMFIDEAKIVGQLSHANICQIYELGKIEEAHFIAMEYIWGKDLLQIQNRARKGGGPMPVPMACHIVSKVCEGLDYAHRRRDPMGQPLEIVHRDCSPQNVLVSYEGEIKIIDFGIAKAASRSSRTMAGVLKGKFGYMSPEQVRGLPLDRRSDIFSVGTILYECLTGERLFQGESDFSTLEKVRNVDIQPPRRVNADIPQQVEDVVMKALSGDVDSRYQWCHEMQSDLQRFLMTQHQVFSTKGLSDWMKGRFETERTRERKQLDEYKKVGRDGRLTAAPPVPDDDIFKTVPESSDEDVEATILGDPGFANILGKRHDTGGQNDDFADEAPTEIFGDSHADSLSELDQLEELSVSTAIPVGPDDDESADAATVMDDGSLEGLVADLQSGRVPPPASPMGTGPAPRPGAPGPHDASRSATAGETLTWEPKQHGSSMSGPGAEQRSAPTAPQRSGPPGSGPMPPPGSGPMPPPGSGPTPQPGPGPGPGFGSGYPPSSPSGPQPGPQSPFGGQHGYFPATSHVAPLQNEPERRKSSLGKDIGIGIGIAVLVLGLFAAGKFFLFKDKKDDEKAAPQQGTIAISLNQGAPADVFVGDEKRGTVSPENALRLELDLGVHQIKVARDGSPPCEKKIELDNANVEREFACEMAPPKPSTGTLRLDALTPEHRVTLDGQELDEAARAGPIELSAETSHQVVLEKDGKRVKFTLTVPGGEEEVRDVDELMKSAVKVTDSDDKDGDDKGADKDADKRGAGNAKNSSDTRRNRDEHQRDTDGKDAREEDTKKASKVGYLTALTTPWAQVHVDGKNTGKTTPISKRNAIELEPGKHKVTFVVGDKKKSFNVDIKAGKTTTLKKVLE